MLVPPIDGSAATESDVWRMPTPFRGEFSVRQFGGPVTHSDRTLVFQLNTVACLLCAISRLRHLQSFACQRLFRRWYEGRQFRTDFVDLVGLQRSWRCPQVAKSLLPLLRFQSQSFDHLVCRLCVVEQTFGL